MPEDPSKLGARALPDASCDANYKGKYYAYYTKDDATAYAITVPLEKIKGNTTTCGGDIDTSVGSFKVVGEGLTYSVGSTSDTPYPPEGQWTDASCFTFVDGTITSYRRDCPNDVIIPPVIDGKTVTSIGDYVFTRSENNKLTSVILPNTIKTIGILAFNNNNLKSIRIPPSVIEINQGAFMSNKFQNIVIEDGHDELKLGDSVFMYSNYEGYTSSQTNAGTIVSLGNRIRTLPYASFAHVPVIKVDLGKVEKIGQSAFMNHKISKLTIPSSVTSIDYISFYCGTIEGCSTDGKYGHPGYLSELIIEHDQKNNDLTIGTSAFGGNSLTVVNLPASVKSVESSAFHGKIQGYLEDFVPNTKQKRVPTRHHYDDYDIWLKDGLPSAT